MKIHGSLLPIFSCALFVVACSPNEKTPESLQELSASVSSPGNPFDQDADGLSDWLEEETLNTDPNSPNQGAIQTFPGNSSDFRLIVERVNPITAKVEYLFIDHIPVAMLSQLSTMEASAPSSLAVSSGSQGHPSQTSTPSQSQPQGGFPPRPVIPEHQGPPTPDEICVSMGSVVGGSGGFLTVVIEDEYCGVWADAICSPGCGNGVGSSTEILDPLGVIGG